MSSLVSQSDLYNSVTGIAIAGQDLYQFGKNIQRSLDGSPNKVHLIIDNVTVVEFDASLQETHGIETSATTYPLEEGAVISDHIIVAPLTLQLTCIVTDTPFFTRKNLVDNALVTAFNATSGALGVLAYNAAKRFATTQSQTVSPSTTVFEQLMRMCAGDRNTTPPTPPQIFDVVTKLRRYPSMVLTGLSVPQDSTTGHALVYSMKFQQVRTVRTRTKTFAQLKAPVVAAPKQKLGQLSAEEQAFQDAAKQRFIDGINATKAATFQAPVEAAP